MKVTVSWEDGDRTSRVMVLATEIRDCIKTGSMRVIGVNFEVDLPRQRIEELVCAEE